MKGQGRTILLNAIGLINLVLLLFISPVNSKAQAIANEYNVKAMFVLNFMKYVEWPPNSNEGVFKIGIIGESEIYDALQAMIANRNENTKIKIEKVKPDVIDNYQIIVITKTERARGEELSKKYQGKGVLIITEEFKDSNYAAINLKTIDNKIRFEINNAQAKLGGIKISSRLVNLAISVQP